MKYFGVLKKLFFSLVIFLVVSETIFLLLPKIVNLNSHKEKVASIIKQEVQTDFSCDNLYFKTYPDFSMQIFADNAEFKDILSVEKFEFKFGLIKLLFNKLIVKDVSVEKMNLNVIRNADNTTNLDVFFEKELPFDLDIANTNLVLNDLKVKIDDRYVNKVSSTNWEVISLNTKDKEMKIRLKGDYIANKEIADIDLTVDMPQPDFKTGFDKTGKYFIATGHIKNLKLKFFEEYLKKYVDKDITNAQGVINAEFVPKYEKDSTSINYNIDINDLKIISKVRENSIIYDKKNTLSGVMVYDKTNMELKNFEFKGDKFKIRVGGLVKNFKTKNPYVDLDVNVDKSRHESIYWLLPSNISPEVKEVQKLKRYGAYADVEGVLKVKGKLLKPDIDGFMNWTNLWILDGLGPDVPKATIFTTFKDDRVNVDVKVWATKNQYVVVQGWSNIWDDTKNYYHITSTKEVPLDITQLVLVPISEVFDFLLGPVPIMSITGLGNIDLFVEGSKENPSLVGYFNFDKTRAALNGINLYIHDATGTVDFKKDKIYFNTKTAKVFNRPASLKGFSDLGINVDYRATVDKVELQNMLNALKTSPMLKEQAKMVAPVSSVKGSVDFVLDIKGKITDIDDPDVMKYLTPSGTMTFHGVEIKMQSPKIVLNDSKGIVKFDTKKSEIDLVSKIYTSYANIKGVISDKADLTINSNKMNLRDAVRYLIGMNVQENTTINLKDVSDKTFFNMSMKYDGDIDYLDFNKINMATVFSEKSKSDYPIDVLSGKMSFNKGSLKVDKLNSKFYNSTIFFDGKVDNALKKPVISANMSMYKLNLDMLNTIQDFPLLPAEYKKILSAYKDFKGTMSVKLKSNKNKLTGNIWLRDISFSHAVLDYPFSLKTADLNFKNGDLNINSLNATFAETPIFINGNIDSIFQNPKYDINVTSKLSTKFVDNYINTNLNYPINVKGEVLFSSKVTGSNSSLNLYPSIKLEEGADVSYMGASFGDENSIRELKGEIKKQNNRITIKNLDYSKYINSQNNRVYPLSLVNLKADMEFIKERLYIKNASIKTENPISANLFNAFFKKSLIKNGNVSCDLNVKGYADNLNILGSLFLKNVEIPSNDIFAKELNIDFTPKHINIESKIDYMESDIDVSAVIKKTLDKKIHIEDLEIHSKQLNLNKLLNSVSEISYSRPIQIVGQTNTKEQIPISVSEITIDEGHWLVDEIKFKTVNANNFSTKFNLKDSTFNMNDILLHIANGNIKGNITYNFKDAHIGTNLVAQDVDANEMSYGFLDIKNQIFGKLNGSIDVTTYGASDEERLKNLDGNLKFVISDGKMPKLGSIEYLLRAGNLLKSGIPGLTINNITSLLIPVKTGNFNTINGELHISNGIVENMKIYSKGDNLSILLMGKYNLVKSEADVYILGKLSKKIDTVFGPVGNASLNSFFNLIPGVHLDELKDSELIKQINSIPELGVKSDKFRIFRAKVDGDIYSEKFVSIFEWIDK